jgi:hypothetical protein
VLGEVLSKSHKLALSQGGHMSSKEKWGTQKGREPPEGKDVLLSPY